MATAKVLPKKLFDSPTLLEDVVQGDVLNLMGDARATKHPLINEHTPLRLFSCGFALESGKAGGIVTVVPWDNSIHWEVQT